jgi:hypothetical protein
MIAMAMRASRQFKLTSTTTATPSRISEIAGDTTASCNNPVVVSTSPVSRDRMPPVFMSHSRGRGRFNNRSNNARRNDSMTRTFNNRCR